MRLQGSSFHDTSGMVYPNIQFQGVSKLMDLVVSPAQGLAKVYQHGSKILICVGRLHYYPDILTITPRQGITAHQRAELVRAYKWLPRTHDVWKRADDGGWVTHLSLPAPFRARHLSIHDPHRTEIRRLLCAGWHDRPVPDSPPRPQLPIVACVAGWKAPGRAHRR